MKCQYCGATENIYKNYTRATKKYGLRTYYKCRTCNTERCKRYRSGDKGKAAVLRSIKKYEASNLERRPAWEKAKYCIPPKPCVVCGQKSPVHRHHPNIAKPLEVVFLCPLHHKEEHKKMEMVV